MLTEFFFTFDYLCTIFSHFKKILFLILKKKTLFLTFNLLNYKSQRMLGVTSRCLQLLRVCFVSSDADAEMFWAD